MKEKIVMFVIGVLVGAIITTGIFLIIRQNDRSKLGEMRGPRNMQIQNSENGNSSERPELSGKEPPAGEKSSGEKPSGKPSEKTNSTNANANEQKTTQSNT